jgi:Family of unknown function (DUF5946)
MSCSGCGAAFELCTGPTHPYIGASPGCWALYTEILASPRNPELLVDAYAVQHHGDGSPQAVQSVGIHLMVLHGILEREMPHERALWIRRRALRSKRVFTKLEPPPVGRSLTLVSAPDLSGYVRSVSDVWHEKHASTIASWFDRYVLRDQR